MPQIEEKNYLDLLFDTKKGKLPRKVTCKKCNFNFTFVGSGRIKYCQKCSENIIKHSRDYVRSIVRKRDNYTCADCGKVRTPEEVQKHNKKIIGLKHKIKMFDVHHLNGMCGKNSRGYDKLESIDGLITLCHKCHFNRPEHGLKNKKLLT